MATVSAPTPKLDRYIVIHVATTCDEHGVYVTKDSAEVIELGWILLDTKTCEELHRESVLVKPVNTPITPLCSKCILCFFFLLFFNPFIYPIPTEHAFLNFPPPASPPFPFTGCISPLVQWLTVSDSKPYNSDMGTRPLGRYLP